MLQHIRVPAFAAAIALLAMMPAAGQSNPPPGPSNSNGAAAAPLLVNGAAVSTSNPLPVLLGAGGSLGSIVNITGTVSLPTGAATSAKQPALGTAGVPAADVLSVQGVPGGASLPVDTVVRATAANRGGLTTVKATGATVTAGGSGYVVGDTITDAAGVFTVATVSSGAVTAVTATTPAALTATTSGALAQSATSGAGTGATLTPAYAPASLQMAAANPTRRGIGIQNQSLSPIWFTGLGAATADQNSFRVDAGAYYESPAHHVGTGAISVIGTIAGQPFYAREF